MYDEQCKPMTTCAENSISTRPTLTMELTKKKERLEAELSKINEVLAIVEKNPAVQDVLDAVSTIRGLI